MPNFVSFAASVAELAHGEKLLTQLLTHSPSFFDAPGTKAHALWNTFVLRFIHLLLSFSSMHNEASAYFYNFQNVASASVVLYTKLLAINLLG